MSEADRMSMEAYRLASRAYALSGDRNLARAARDIWAEVARHLDAADTRLRSLMTQAERDRLVPSAEVPHQENTP